MLLATRDLSAAKAAEDAIRNLSFYDDLTALPNRRHLLEHLRARQLDPVRRARSALLSINLDHFRAINDSFGPAAGDRLLREAGQRVAACVREGDTVARTGGDEFSVLLEHVGESEQDAADQARTIAERVLGAMSEPCSPAGQVCHCTASIGITIFGEEAPGAEELLQQSGIAVDHARMAGRNTLRFFSPALQAAVSERMAILSDLRRAIDSDQLVLWYQPQIHRGQLFGAEALVRWQHPVRGLLGPAAFIPLAEEAGLIVPLGDWVLEAACRQVAEWAGRRQLPEIRVAVNISARQFRQTDFAAKVLDTIVRTGADPANLELELTESSLVNDVEAVVARMAELKAHGLRFAVDDFGVGYSSLSYLQRLPLDKLKIDRSFVRDMLVDPGSSAIARAVISLSQALGLKVIAEGVDAEEQRAYLARLGCDAWQGFLFSEPLPAAKFEELLVAPGAPGAPVAYGDTAPTGNDAPPIRADRSLAGDTVHPSQGAAGNFRRRGERKAREDVAGKARARRGRGKDTDTAAAVPVARLHAGQAGGWMEASALRGWVMGQLGQGQPPEMIIDLEGLEHLDASALQVLLAIGSEQKRRGGVLRLENVSAGMRQWFAWAGAAELPEFAEARRQAPAEEAGTCAKF